MNKKIILTLIILIIIILTGTGIYSFISISDNNKEKEVKTFKIVKEIEGYNYTLRDNQTDLYKSIFTNLEAVLNNDNLVEEEYAKSIAQLFIIDFFTLNDKATKNDIGGTEFVHPKIQNNFTTKAKDTVYKYVENNIYGDRKQELPIVSEISIKETSNIKYTYLSNTDNNAYEITMEWGYEKDLGYQTKGTVIIVHEDEKLSIVEFK